MYNLKNAAVLRKYKHRNWFAAEETVAMFTGKKMLSVMQFTENNNTATTLVVDLATYLNLVAATAEFYERLRLF